MKILLVYAHPEPTSLNGSLKNFLVKHLENAGHSVQVSDLYAMKWKAQIDADDRTDRDPNVSYFSPFADSEHAFTNGTQSADIAAEQAKIMWADTILFQFPLWWFSMPAIMKGWVERVYANGFAYHVGEHSATHWGDRYGEGTLAGKRAMLITTVGGWESHYSPRGINGAIDDILFPIHHGILYYPGLEVLPPFVVYRSTRVDEPKFSEICNELGKRLDDLATTAPIPFRMQNTGDYEIPALTLKENIAPGQSGFSVHLKN